MSKTFKRQDYFRYKRLGKKWRRPVGWQSKLRLRKAGSGMRVSIGYGTEGIEQPLLVRNERDLLKGSKFILIAASIGSKKASVIAAKAKELGITVINMKKVHKAERIKKSIAVAKKETKKEHKKEEKKTEENKEPAEHKHEHREDVRVTEHKEGDHTHPHREADS